MVAKYIHIYIPNQSSAKSHNWLLSEEIGTIKEKKDAAGKSIKCSVCGQTFTKFSILRNTQKYTINSKSSTVVISAEKNFWSKWSLSNHEKIHSDKRGRHAINSIVSSHALLRNFGAGLVRHVKRICGYSDIKK